VSNAPLEYARPIFEERQRLRLGRGMHALLVATAIFGVLGCAVLFARFHNPLIRVAAGLILLAAAVALALPYLVLTGMTTRVDGEGLHVRFGAIPWRTIAATTIAAVEPCTYDAFKEFGGYGMRLRQNARDDCYTIAGDQGVRLTLNDGRKILVGTEQRDALATAVRSLLGTTPATPAESSVTRPE
jgi:hypothetical protein